MDALGSALAGIDPAPSRDPVEQRRSVLVLRSAELAEAVPITVVIDAVERAYRLAGNDQLAQHPRLAVRDPGTRTFLHLLPAVSGAAGVAGAHVYTGGNRGAGVPQKVTLLFDAGDGGLRAIIESSWLSWARTGATGAVATKVLARPDAQTLGIIGSGRQARAQAVAIAASRPLRRVLVHSPNPEHRERFATEMSDRLGVSVEPMERADDVVSRADIVSTTTTSREPVFGADAVRPGLHVNAIGAHYPERRELDGATIERARVFADDVARSELEDGEVRLARTEGATEPGLQVESLAAVVAGMALGRRNDAEVTVLLSGGLGSEYLLAAAAVVDHGEALGLGTRITL